MRDSSRFRLFLEPIVSLQKLMKKSNSEWMIIGGVAASLLGKPRFTADIDVVALAEDSDISYILKLAEETGFRARVKDAAGFAQKNRILLLLHKKSGMNVDISLGFLPFEKDAIKRSTLHRVNKAVFRLPTPEDLIIFKAVAHRPQDIIDIGEIVNNNPKIDVKYIKRMITDFANALDMPEVWTDIKPIISRSGQRQNRKC